MKGFRDFILRGNVVDLAVAVVIGAAFNSVVASLVKDVITPLISAIGGQPNFSDLVFTVNNSTFTIGNFLNNIISFLIVASVIYFLVVMPLNKVLAKLKKQAPAAEPSEKVCSECLSLIPIKARRCKFCTSVQKTK